MTQPRTSVSDLPTLAREFVTAREEWQGSQEGRQRLDDRYHAARIALEREVIVQLLTDELTPEAAYAAIYGDAQMFDIGLLARNLASSLIYAITELGK